MKKRYATTRESLGSMMEAENSFFGLGGASRLAGSSMTQVGAVDP